MVDAPLFAAVDATPLMPSERWDRHLFGSPASNCSDASSSSAFSDCVLLPDAAGSDSPFRPLSPTQDRRYTTLVERVRQQNARAHIRSQAQHRTSGGGARLERQSSAAPVGQLQRQPSMLGRAPSVSQPRGMLLEASRLSDALVGIETAQTRILHARVSQLSEAYAARST